MTLLDKIRELYIGNGLHEAIGNRDHQSAEKWSRMTKYVNSFDRAYYTPLHHSLITEQYNITILLLGRGADPNFFSPKVGSPLNRYLHGHHNNNAVKILALYGATLDSVHSLDKLQDILPLYEKYRKTYLKIQEFQQQTQDQNASPEEKRQAYLGLTNIWHEMAQDENSFEEPNTTFQTHYRHLAFLNKQKADEMLSYPSQAFFAEKSSPPTPLSLASSANVNTLHLRSNKKTESPERTFIP